MAPLVLIIVLNSAPHKHRLFKSPVESSYKNFVELIESIAKRVGSS
jgi:hypothetical protein